MSQKKIRHIRQYQELARRGKKIDVEAIGATLETIYSTPQGRSTIPVPLRAERPDSATLINGAFLSRSAKELT